MGKALSLLDQLEEKMVVFGFVVLIFIVFLQVIMRYVIGSSLVWSAEISRYIFIFLTWIGASIAVKDEKHISVNILFEIFPGLKQYFGVISTLLCLAVTLFLFINGTELVMLLKTRTALSPALRIPMWIIYISIPLGGFLMTVNYIRRLIVKDIPLLRGGGN